MDTDKKLFRNKCKKKLLNNNKRYIYSYFINNVLINLILSLNKKNILFFLPLELEADIYKSIKYLKQKKFNIFVPFVYGKSFYSVPFSLPLKKNKFNIIEPKNKNKTLKKIDVMIVPVIGIDKHFKRVGFGKGMYDRFYASIKYKKPTIIFIQLLPCISNNTITNHYDIKGDYFISYKMLLKRRKYARNTNLFKYSRSCCFFYNKKNR